MTDTPYMVRRGHIGQRTVPPVPPAQLEPDTFAARLYDALAPLAQADPDYAWSLLILCNAVGTMYQSVEDLVRDTPAGPGWSSLVDLDRCPDTALAWLAQFAGVRVLPGSTPAEQRARIASTGGFRRGTRDAMIGAARATLTGGGTVVFRERDGVALGYPAVPEYAYYLSVITYADETPDSTATLRALTAQKPGGIVLNYRTNVGQDWQSVNTNNASWQHVMDTYSSWSAVLVDETGARGRD